MPRSKEQFNLMKMERREALLSASLFLYATQGGKLTIDEIADKAKCSHGIVYHYFANVEEVANKLLSSKIYVNILENFAKPHKFLFARDELRRIVEGLISLEEPKEMLYAVVMFNDDSKKSFKANFIKLIERGQKDSEVTGGNPEDIANCIIYLLKGYYLDCIQNKNKNTSKLSLDNVMELLRKR